MPLTIIKREGVFNPPGARIPIHIVTYISKKHDLKFTFFTDDEIKIAKEIMESDNIIMAILNSQNEHAHIRRLCKFKLKYPRIIINEKKYTKNEEIC